MLYLQQNDDHDDDGDWVDIWSLTRSFRRWHYDKFCSYFVYNFAMKILMYFRRALVEATPTGGGLPRPGRGCKQVVTCWRCRRRGAAQRQSAALRAPNVRLWRHSRQRKCCRWRHNDGESGRRWRWGQRSGMCVTCCSQSISQSVVLFAQ